jgi:DNA-binding NtrC family response regulator
MTPAELPFGRPSNGAPADTTGAASADPATQALFELPYREAKEKSLEAFETAYFEGLLARTQGNVSEAARQAGLDRSNFRRAVKRAGVRVRDDE